MAVSACFLSDLCDHSLPRTSSFSTCKRFSLTSRNPLRRVSFVWSRSPRAVATTGTLDVRSSRRASSIPIPREAGVTSAHGCIVRSLMLGYLTGYRSQCIPRWAFCGRQQNDDCDDDCEQMQHRTFEVRCEAVAKETMCTGFALDLLVLPTTIPLVASLTVPRRS